MFCLNFNKIFILILFLVNVITSAKATDDLLEKKATVATTTGAVPATSAAPIDSVIPLSDERRLDSKTHHAALKGICLRNILSFLDVESGMNFRMVSVYGMHVADTTIFSAINGSPLFMLPYSSAIENSPPIRTAIYRFLNKAQRRIVIVSDQFLDDGLAEYLAKRRADSADLKVSVICGKNEKVKSGLLAKLSTSNIDYHPFDYAGLGLGKMHNKFIIIDDSVVLTGSPNATKAAYDNNIESLVAIRNPFVNRLYSAYHQYILSSKAHRFDDTKPDFKRVHDLMTQLNSMTNCPLQVCLAPVGNIRTFVTQKITGARQILINMFLVSRASKDQESDILGTLEQEAKNGCQVCVNVDASNLMAPHSRAALKFTHEKPNLDVYVVELKNRTCFHDKLLMIIDQRNLMPIVIIGSAGFSREVQDNLNQENMISITSQNSAPGREVRLFFRRHIDAINAKNPRVKRYSKYEPPKE